MEGITKEYFGNRVLSPWARRRKRCRKVDPDEHPLRDAHRGYGHRERGWLHTYH
jgi:hypothetical protein